MESLLIFGSPVAIIGVVLTAYGLLLKLREVPVQGWHFRVSRERIATNGLLDVDVRIRLMGQAVLYECKVRVWGVATVRFDTGHRLPKMTCDDDPIELNVSFPVGPVEKAPWVGVTWLEPSKGIGVEQCARYNVWTDEYQRWQWNRIRNVFRFNCAPKGHWRTIEEKSPRTRFHVERWSGDGQKVDPASVKPHDIWGF
ncbi:hypothetical protein IU450_09015 [Nocardia abscessus]|uniref:hypothetical protein n=1 Tax=Nocardia abscessus TaxID=120957 RepID=UPI0018935770|nr:hypothetical protein [Nocardia abscessus]MBF6336025.1 hypothetical protein [Nocardia abscessus]